MPKDGLGWHVEKICRLMSFYGWSEDYVLRRLIGARGWIYFNYAIENQMIVVGKNSERKTDGYVAREMRKILARRKKK
jgi:hypothetical protein